jgi:hypothetical protein
MMSSWLIPELHRGAPVTSAQVRGGALENEHDRDYI